MTLMTRIMNLFKADVNGILDCLEEPEAILKQAIREMRDDLQAKEACLKHLRKQVERYGRMHAALLDDLVQLDAQINLCFQQNDERLAKSLVSRKLEASKRLKALESRNTAIKMEISELQTTLDEQQEKLHEVLEKQQLFSHLDTNQDGGIQDEPILSGSRTSVPNDEVEAAFLQAKMRWEGASNLKSD